MAREGEKRDHPGEPGLYAVRNPFADLPRDVLRGALKTAFELDAAKYEPALDRLMRMVTSRDPVALLACAAIFSRAQLPAGVDVGGGISQFHVELLQAAVLTVPADEVGKVPPGLLAAGAAIEAVRDLADAYSKGRVASALEKAGEEPDTAFLTRQHVGVHRQFVRNWAYHKQGLGILRRLYGPLDEACRTATGITASQMLDVFDWMVDRTGERMAWFVTAMREVRAASSARERILAYTGAFGLGSGLADSFLAMPDVDSMSPDEQSNLIAAHAFSVVAPSVFTFTSRELAAAAGADEGVVAQALERFSLGFGDLAGTRMASVHMENPVWCKPLLRLGPGRFANFLPQLFFHSAFPIFEQVLAGASKAHARRRAVFLEAEVASVFAKAFGDHMVHAGVKWKLGGQQFETDLLVLVDTHLFIIEAKAHRLSAPGLRGAPDRLRRHVKELLVEPAIQSTRLREAIAAWQAGSAPDLELECGLDLGKVRDVTRVSVILEDFATIQSNLATYAGLSAFPPGVGPAVTLCLADLETVVDLLGNPIEVIHYLKSRERLQGRMEYLADEVDLLGLYLSTGFCLGEMEAGGVGVMAVGMSKEIDDYYLRVEAGLPVERRPGRRYTPWFKAIRDRMARRGFERWTEAAQVVLALSLEDQEALERQVADLRGRMLAGDLDAATGTPLNTALVVPPPWRDLGLAVVLLDKADIARRKEAMIGAATSLFEECHAGRCVVLALRLHGEDLPYAAILLADREEIMG